MPRKIRQLVKDLTKAGYQWNPKRGKGAPRWYEHPRPGVPSVNITGKLGADAKPYQEDDVRDALEAVRDDR